ncbi:MAG TPA: hypothetical protein VGK98_10445 [Arthrobacter sp.]|jgi:hypothetical protein|uniref:hypothetical protein n=1 Tax=Arthrobacter sp. TaxID=1667 RepID=UPI002F406F07
MRTRTRNATVVAGIAILLGTAGGGMLTAQGPAKQQISNDAVILVSATSPGHHSRGEHRTTHRTRNRSAQETTVQNPAAVAGVEAAADVEAWGRAASQSPNGATNTEVVLRSLPGLDADGDSCP